MSGVYQIDLGKNNNRFLDPIPRGNEVERFLKSLAIEKSKPGFFSSQIRRPVGPIIPGFQTSEECI